MNEELIFKASRIKLMACSTFLAILAYIGASGIQHSPITGWLFSILFGIGALTILTATFTDTMRITLTESGLTIFGIHKPIEYNWAELAPFDISKLNGLLKVISVSYNLSNRRKTLSNMAIGVDRYIMNFYSTPLNDICDVLNSWHQRYTKQSSNNSLRLPPSTPES